MSNGRVYISHYPGNPPDWYWTSGLHDACIVGADAFEFPFDYGKFVGEKNKYNRNALILQINSKNALYDNSVKEIRFFNYKLLSDQVTLEGRANVWWLSDRLVEQNGYYILEIDLQDFDSEPENFTFAIKFERAEVCRV